MDNWSNYVTGGQHRSDHWYGTSSSYRAEWLLVCGASCNVHLWSGERCSLVDPDVTRRVVSGTERVGTFGRYHEDVAEYHIAGVIFSSI